MRYGQGLRALPVLLVALMFLLAGCGGQPAASPAPSAGSSEPAAKSPIVIGGVMPLTSGGSIYGRQMIGAAKLAVKQVNDAGGINGRPVDLVVEDGSDSNTTALNALQKVLEKKPVAMIGSVYGAQMLAMLPIIDQEGLPTITISGTRKVTQQGSKNVFRVNPHDGVTKVALAKYLLDDLKKTRIGMIVVAEEWGYSARDIFAAVLKDRNMQPVGVEAYQKTDQDLSAQLLNLKKAGADVIMVQGFPADTALVLRQARQLNLGITMAGSSVAQSAAALDITTGADVDGLLAEGLAIPTQSDDPKIQAWTKAFKDLMGYDPDQYGLEQFDGIQALFQVIRNGATTRDAVRKGLSEISYQGLSINIKADAFGDMVNSATIWQYDSKKTGKRLKTVVVTAKEQK